MRKRRPRWWPPITSRRARARLAKRMAEIGAVAGAGPAPAFRNRLRDELMLAARAAAPPRAARPPPSPSARRDPAARRPRHGHRRDGDRARHLPLGAR